MNPQVMRRTLTTGLLALTLLAAFLQRTPPSEPLRPAHTVVLLLTPGLSASEAATLLGFDGSSGALRGVMTTRSPADSEPSAEPLLLAARTLATGDRMLSADASPSALTLGGALRRAGVHALPLTDSDTAAAEILGLPRPDPLLSDIPRWRQNQGSLPDGYVTAPAPFAHALAKAVRAAGEPGEPPTLIIATFDDLYRDDLYAPFALMGATRAQRRGSLFHLAAALDRLTAQDSPDRLSGDVALLTVTPLPSLDARQRGERLGPIALWRANGNPGSPDQILTSPSTRSTPGLIAGTDVAATVASLLGLSPDQAAVGAGRPARAVPDDGRLGRRITAWDAQARAQALLIYVPWALAALLIAASVLAQRGLPRPAFAVGVAALLYPTSLIACAGLPTLESNAPLFYLLAAVPPLLAAILALTLPSVLPHRSHILGGIGLLTTTLLMGDTLTGGYLLAHAPLSYSVMEAARFYGIGNEAAGLLIGASLLAIALLFDGDMVAIGLFGAAVCLTLALPMLGAKAGSLLGAATGFGVALGLRSAVSLSRRRLVRLLSTAFGVSVVILVALALWDNFRSPDAQTHVGLAVAGAQRVGIGALFTIAQRKASMDVHLAISSPWAVLLATEMGLLVYSLRKKSPAPHEGETPRVALLPLCAAGVCLLFLNDAGVLGAATCLLFAIPLLLISPRRQT